VCGVSNATGAGRVSIEPEVSSERTFYSETGLGAPRRARRAVLSDTARADAEAGSAGIFPWEKAKDGGINPFHPPLMHCLYPGWNRRRRGAIWARGGGGRRPGKPRGMVREIADSPNVLIPPKVLLAKNQRLPRLCGSLSETTDMIHELTTNWLVFAQSSQPPGQWMMIPMILMLVAMFVLMSSSQRKKQRQHEERLKTLKTGDKITTSSGIVGIVVGLKDKSVNIRSADTKLEILKSAVSEITERGGETAPTAS
jgi:preprotein translocase subunit YajC